MPVIMLFMNKTLEKINIRKATPEDGDVLCNLISALADYEKLTPPDAEAKERLKTDACGPFPRITAWLAEFEGKVVGYAITLFTYSSFLAKPTLYIEDIFVLPEYRKNGIGKALFEYCTLIALQEDCGRLEFQVLDWNKSAIDFYEKKGAKHLKEWYPFRMERETLIKLINKS